MQVEIEGKVTKVFELRTGISARTGNEWKRQDYLIETPGQYPRRCLATVADGNIDMFNLQEGKQVRVTISIDAHEYAGRWYNDFRITGVGDPMATTQQPGVPPIGEPAPQSVGASGSDSALPWE